MFKCIFLNENAWIPIKLSMKFIPKGSINNIPALFQIMAWCRPGDTPLSESVMVSLQAHICFTRPQSVIHLVSSPPTEALSANRSLIRSPTYTWLPSLKRTDLRSNNSMLDNGLAPSVARSSQDMIYGPIAQKNYRPLRNKHHQIQSWHFLWMSTMKFKYYI